MNEILISVVSPVYRAEKLIQLLVDKISEELETITPHFEIILVEDNSPDSSWQKMLEAAAKNPKVKAVKMARNFGQQYALAAGLSLAKGRWIATMDCDLQDDPTELVKMYHYAIANNCDGVLASRSTRKDDWFKKTASTQFYKILSYLTDSKIDPSIANFYLCKAKVFKAIESMGDYYRYLPVMIRWVGFDIRVLEIQHASRQDGLKSSYSFKKRMKLAYETILSFSEKPLRLMISLGFTLSLIAFILGLLLIISYLFGGFKTPGWASLFVALSVYSGIIISTLGLVGVYVGKTFETVKGRPTFIIDRIVQNGEDQLN